jgi:hypothetical protein
MRRFDHALTCQAHNCGPMRTLRSILLSATALMTLHSQTARAADPARFDILSLQLHMSAPEALERLRAQGIPDARVQLSPPGCVAAQAAHCASAISARTRDGQMLIQFTAAANGAGQPIVARIAYTIVARGPSDTATIRADAIDRYGTPSSLSTTTWCARVDLATGTCPANQPLLRVEPAPKAAGLITLSDGSLPDRTPRTSESHLVAESSRRLGGYSHGRQGKDLAEEDSAPPLKGGPIYLCDPGVRAFVGQNFLCDRFDTLAVTDARDFWQ